VQSAEHYEKVGHFSELSIYLKGIYLLKCNTMKISTSSQLFWRNVTSIFSVEEQANQATSKKQSQIVLFIVAALRTSELT
jgi:hypothetical protein